MVKILKRCLVQEQDKDLPIINDYFGASNTIP